MALHIPAGCLEVMRLAAVGWFLAASILTTPPILAGELGSRTRVGILNSLNTSLGSPAITRFFQELERSGYVNGVNLSIDVRSAEDRPARLADLARELVGLKPDVIVTMGIAEATVAAMKVTAATPIVFVHAVDPVRAGLVASRSRPGGNVTGVTSLNADLGAKQLELITEIVPGIRRVAVMVNPVDPETPQMLEALGSAARARRVQLDALEIRDPTRLGGALRDAMKREAGALLVLGSPVLYRLSPALAQLTAKHRIPTVSAWREFPQAGGLASYGTNLPDMFQRAAGLVVRILQGAKPAESPIEQPTTFELVVNLKTAKALGLSIPESILLRAEVIR
jgi:putative ABC transport system substrate-binding protein